jgi:hypothetical protein
MASMIGVSAPVRRRRWPLVALTGWLLATATAGVGGQPGGGPNVAPPAPPALPSIPDRSVEVAAFGAVPDDGQDDTAAIQRAIDDVTDDGGGSVLFASGVYDLSMRGTAVRERFAIFLRPKLRLAPLPEAAPVLRLANNQGNFKAMFVNPPTRDDQEFPDGAADDVVFEGLAFDANSANNPVLAEADFRADGEQTPRFVIQYYVGARLLVAGCTFRNHLGANTISANGEDVSDVTIRDNRFLAIGGNPVDFDHSTIYTNNRRTVIANNRFESRDGEGTNGVRTAIEIHGDDQSVTDNTVVGFTNGINVTGDGTGSIRNAERHLVAGNQFLDAYNGVLIWSFYDDRRDRGQPALSDAAIRDNTIVIAMDPWLNGSQLDQSAFAKGIGFELGEAREVVNDLEISGNTIRFTQFAGAASDPDFAGQGIGISLLKGRAVDRRESVVGLLVAGNTIESPLSVGIWGNTAITGRRGSSATFTDNTVIAPGQRDDLTAGGLLLEGGVKLAGVRVDGLRVESSVGSTDIEFGFRAGRCEKGCSVARVVVVGDDDAPPIVTGRGWRRAE